MLALIRSLFPPLASLSLMMLASGYFNTFISIRLEMAEYGPEMIGLVTSALYGGILIGSLRMDRWIIKMGHIRSFVFLAAVLTAIPLLQAFWIDAWYWVALRLVTGICTAGVFIVIESWILMQSLPNLRGGVLSIYLGVFYGSLALGQLFIDVVKPLSIFPFIIPALIMAASVLPITVRNVTEPLMKEEERLNLIQLFRISPLGFIGGIVSGMVMAIIFGLVPYYSKEIGMSVSEIGIFMAVMIFGGFCLQWPVGRWADYTDRRIVLQWMSFMSAIFALGVVWATNSFVAHLILAWFFGGFSCTLYPLSMAYACERVHESQIVAATGGFVLSYGLGAIAGPLLAPIAMNFVGPEGLFYYLSAITFLLGLVGFKKPWPVRTD